MVRYARLLLVLPTLLNLLNRLLLLLLLPSPTQTGKSQLESGRIGRRPERVQERQQPRVLHFTIN